jgi:hypothetical protein
MCPQVKRESQFVEMPQKSESEDETMTPLFDDLQIVRIKEKFIVGKRAFYEIECSNLSPNKPVLLAERYVKAFLPDHLNRFNSSHLMEIDT